MFNLSNRHILITGATGYLGRSVAKGLAELGGLIHINSRNSYDCQTLVNEIVAEGYQAFNASFDVTDELEVKEYVNSIDVLDVLINNTYAGRGGTLLTASKEDFMNSYNVSVVASANLIKMLEAKLADSAQRNSTSSVINIASMYGMVSPDASIYDTDELTNPPYYGAAKAALIQLTKYAACELADKNIRVNCISPGTFPSAAVQQNMPNLINKIVLKVPMKRIGQPSELIGPIAFLSSDAASFLTGANIPVDGGWTAW
jgi:NAD(P)-dependent dehydrogenase (short-subunit alcohol dehydrogenase family)